MVMGITVMRMRKMAAINEQRWSAGINCLVGQMLEEGNGELDDDAKGVEMRKWMLSVSHLTYLRGGALEQGDGALLVLVRFWNGSFSVLFWYF